MTRNRSSFRDNGAERTHTPHAIMEAALAHVVKNKVEAAYARSDLFEKRRALMQSWSEYLAARLRGHRSDRDSHEHHDAPDVGFVARVGGALGAAPVALDEEPEDDFPAACRVAHCG